MIKYQGIQSYFTIIPNPYSFLTPEDAKAQVTKK